VISGAAGVVALLTCGLVLLGWRLDLDPLKDVRPGASRMVPNVAVGVALAGAALWLLRREPVPRPGRWLAAVAAVAAALVGLLTLAEYLLGRDLGIDPLLVPQTAYPVRPALHTALALALLGLALGLMDMRLPGCARASQLLTALATLIALLALIGHAFAVPPFYGGSPSGRPAPAWPRTRPSPSRCWERASCAPAPTAA
jgi:hypothetical protein